MPRERHERTIQNTQRRRPRTLELGARRLGLPRGLVGHGDCGSLAEARLSTGADGGGTTGPMSPSGASSRSTITGA
jgi:hypothetical protein